MQSAILVFMCEIMCSKVAWLRFHANIPQLLTTCLEGPWQSSWCCDDCKYSLGPRKRRRRDRRRAVMVGVPEYRARVHDRKCVSECVTFEFLIPGIHPSLRVGSWSHEVSQAIAGHLE